MTNDEIYRLAKAEDVRCIKPLMNLVTLAALEILKLESKTPVPEGVKFVDLFPRP
jgi:hypothetical protein